VGAVGVGGGGGGGGGGLARTPILHAACEVNRRDDLLQE